MAEWLKKEAPADYPQRDDLTAKQICTLARAGDAWARRAVDREIYYPVSAWPTW